MAGITTYLSILTLHVNGFNTPSKKYWIKKEDLTICSLQNTHLKDRNKQYLTVKRSKRVYLTKDPQNQAGVAILYKYNI
jgi:hypothetical protein